MSSTAFAPTITVERPYDAAEMAVFLMNGRQHDVFVECLETGAVFFASDIRVLKDPWINQTF